MSRCAHAQSTYVLRKLPRCSKCKEEFALVMAVYENKDGKADKPIEEWECPKCGKTVPKNFLKEEGILEQDKELHNWCVNEQKKRCRRKNK